MKGERGGGGGEMRAGVGRGGFKVTKYTSAIQWRDFFQSQEFFVDDDTDSLLLGQATSRLNFYF